MSARRERKVVTVLFADLVGFTSRAETLDPEDVALLLEGYHDHLRSELERFGGTVEKFIGDAVMALFGAPVAHEDDPERAVRAALAIRDWARERDDLNVRVGLTTGEVVVMLDAAAAQAMAAGDVVNTASRLQAAAPENGILVDETTYRATQLVIEYRDAPPVDAKGKKEPVLVWEAVDARARFGPDFVKSGASLVGRKRELGVLTDAFSRARSTHEPQLITLVGVPGIGKSRLVYEFFQQGIEPDRELISWRQGRCLPYGEGVTYWAVGEMVKAQAGILDTDSAEGAAAKLARAVGSAVGQRLDLGRAHAAPARWTGRRGRARGGQAGGGARGLAPLLRGARRAAPARARLRGSPLGGRRAARFRGRPRLLGERSPSDPRLHCAARAARSTARLGRRQDQRDDARPRAVVGRGDRTNRRRVDRPSRAAGRGPADAARAEPAATRSMPSNTRECSRSAARSKICRCPKPFKA